MRTYTLDAGRMTTLEALYDELAHVFQLPSYFGRNLDALEECLQEMVAKEGPMTVVVKESALIKTQPFWADVCEILKDCHIALEEA